MRRKEPQRFSLARIVRDGSLTHAALAAAFALLALLVLRLPFERGLAICALLAREGAHATANWAGFGMSQVALSGHRHASDSDIFDALRLKGVRSMLDYDSRAARERIERLPWVAKAEISRVYPDQMSVAITERTPYAVWRNGPENVLIDSTGRVLDRVPLTARPELPRLRGEGAADLAATIFAAIARFPDVSHRFVAAERVGNRRWTLELNNGARLLLPADRELAALMLATGHPELRKALLQGGQVIDLRIAGRATLRVSDAALDTSARKE